MHFHCKVEPTLTVYFFFSVHIFAHPMGYCVRVCVCERERERVSDVNGCLELRVMKIKNGEDCSEREGQGDSKILAHLCFIEDLYKNQQSMTSLVGLKLT
jgi:hypothetical protein